VLWCRGFFCFCFFTTEGTEGTEKRGGRVREEDERGGGEVGEPSPRPSPRGRGGKKEIPRKKERRKERRKERKKERKRKRGEGVSH